MIPTCPECGSIRTEKKGKLRRCKDCGHVNRPERFDTQRQMLERDYDDYIDGRVERKPGAE